MHSYQGQSNDKATVNVMVHRLSEKLDRESKRWSNGLLKLGIPSNKVRKGSTSGASSSSSSSSSPSISSIPSTPIESNEPSTTMQFQSSYRLPFPPSSLAKKDWNTSSIYAQLQQHQEMKSKIEALEQKLKHDHQVFEKQRTILMDEIKMKDKQLLEKEQQWEARWSAKLQELQQQLETERNNHEDNICEWKTRYQAAMDTEQQKHYRRLTYFHERLTAKNMEYAELEQLLARSAPVSPIRSPVSPEGLTPVSQMTHGENDALSLTTTSTTMDNDDKHATLPKTRTYHGHRSSSLDDSASPKTTLLGATTQFAIADPAIRKGRLELAMARHSSNTRKGDIGDSLPLLPMDDLYACELQDMTLRHQASVDNMAAEYEENKVELLEQHRREKELWKLEHDSELQNARMQLVQDHERHMNQINQTWQQKWDDMVAQNKRDQAELQKQWEDQSKSDKRAWEDCKTREQDTLRKQLGWSKYELDLMLKEHKEATILAKQLSLAIDPDADVEDMTLTLVDLLENGIQSVSRLTSLRCHLEKSDEPAPLFGLWNLSF